MTKEEAENYQQGFNEGYILAQHQPELSEKLAEVKGGGLRMEGFRDGREEWMQERLKDRLPDWLKKNPRERMQKDAKQAHKDKDKDADRE